MGTLVIILILGGIAGAVFWNHKTQGAAMAGALHRVPHSVDEVADAIRTLYCGGAGAKIRSTMKRVKVAPSGSGSFRLESSLGDVGTIRLTSVDDGTEIEAHTDELYVGSHPSGHFRRGIAGIAASIVHTGCKVCGVSPGAGRMKSFQSSIGPKVQRHLEKQTSRR
jgi:hypothetical protein